MNRRLDEEELNQLGYITENEFLHSITKDDFAKTATKLGRISYVDTEQDADNYGLTPFGFIQLLKSKIANDVDEILEKLGYDENLYSTKSKLFVVSIHAERPLQLSFKDAIGTSMNERAQDYILNNEIKTEGLGDMFEDEDDLAIFAINHPEAASRTVGVVNKTQNHLKVTVDLTQSKGVKFTPTSGKVTKVIPPKTLRYMCSLILDPTVGDNASVRVDKTYEVFNVDTPANDTPVENQADASEGAGFGN